jgi:thermostable 8-oxoguanine DNA glycosylase
MYIDRDRRHVIENRASNIIASAIRLMEQIEQTYDAEQAENLQRKLINAIKMRDASKFTRTVRRTDESQ